MVITDGKNMNGVLLMVLRTVMAITNGTNGVLRMVY